VWHHGGAEDADRQQHRLRALEGRQDGVLGHGAEGRVREPELRDVARGDGADERDDHRLDRPEAIALQREDRERRRAGDQRGGEEADPEQEVEAERGAEELREVGCHRDQLGLDPEPDRHALRELFAADLGEVAPRGDPQLRRQGLDEHRHQVRGDDHPDERVTELGAAGDVRGEVPGVDVRDRCDEGRAEEGKQTKPGVPAQDALARPRDRQKLVLARRHHS
jgi:hypothetical protein